ncbi:squalene--hopene cyclase [Sporosarcina koreensis]|uniref:Squalene--hopene cyclase n=1 Tax=Sporosarcina koreensis TaxID=334735 RepID=A0ABW0TVU5_9BACL
MNRLILQLKKDQTHNGSWEYPFETGISTDAYMIILLRTLEMDEEELIRELTSRILSRQEANGAWKLFHDEENGNLSSTVAAYYSLLYSGYVSKEDSTMQAAKKFILANGGIEKSLLFTKIMLALTGQVEWPPYFPLPVEMILLPPELPISFYDISVFGRSNLAPIMIVADKKFVKKTRRSPTLSDLYAATETDEFFNVHDIQQLISLIEHGFKSVPGLPHYIHELAMNRAKQYMLTRLEPDGTLCSYFSSTFLMIFALLALGHSNRDPLIIKAIRGLQSMKCTIQGHIHMQYTTATVWNTNLISFALQQAGVPSTDAIVQKANHYLAKRQQTTYGDWALHNPGVIPGGWGFSDIDTFIPDIDDTTASLRAISQLVGTDPHFHQAWNKGVQWILSMQNSDGGWASFEKNVNDALVHILPIEGGRFFITDSSSADLTGRTLEFLGNYTNLPKHHQTIKRGVDWLLHHQEKDGSWYGRWGICYIYGTWAAITGLAASGVSAQHPSIQKAVNWLHSIQNADGGWGESCKSDLANTYVPLGSSNRTQSAWALDALIAASDQPTPEINNGIAYLLKASNQNDWTNSYPVGQGMGGGFYIHYHSYQYIFPLLAIAHYKRKFII